MDDDATGDLSARVRGSVARVYRRFRSERATGDLGDTAFEVLSWLHKVGPQTLTALSAEAGVAPGSMSQTVNRLTSAGYAERRPDPDDGRKVRIGVTDSGAALAHESRVRRTAWLDGRLATLTDDERVAIARACDLLDRIAEGPR
jgi:DNA-binding MarR family transcriptional regulator